MAMKSMEMLLGHAASHSAWLVHEPKYSSMTSTMRSVRDQRSVCPWGRRLRWAIFAAVNRLAAPLGHAATQAPQPMHAAASNAVSATIFGTSVRFASGADPVSAEM